MSAKCSPPANTHDDELQVLSKSTGDGANDDDDENENVTDFSPLSIEGGPHDHDGRRPIPVLLPASVECHRCRRRAIACLSIATLSVAACFAVVRRFFPTYLPMPNFGGKHSSAEVCLSRRPLPVENRTEVGGLDLNRVATALSRPSDFEGLNGAFAGFVWNDGDAKTVKWRPQGIATLSEGDRRFVLISWYGRADQNYAERGARISFVDVSSLGADASNEHRNQTYSYRHVLLVDQAFCTLPHIHAGGIEYQNGKIYVADSRKGQQAVLVFDVAKDLYEIPEELQGELFNYRYLLRSDSSFHVPIKPSFISFDVNAEKFVVGTYSRCGNAIGMHTDTSKCMTRSDNRLVWFSEKEASLTHPAYCEPFFAEMQGAVTAITGRGPTLWVVSSYGPYADSHLHIVNGFDPRLCSNESFMGVSTYQRFLYPPGLEDLHVEVDRRRSNSQRNIWMLTEFGTRMVFATALESF